MARVRRVYYDRAVYHIFNRGNNRIKVFQEDDDKIIFLEVLGRYQSRLEFKIYGIVLMNNHYHMMVETSEKHDISKVMHAMTLAFGRRYHKRHQYVGHLWQSRFKSRIIETEAYGQECLDYIHQNPVKAGIVEKVQDYEWSSVLKYEGQIGLTIEKYIKVDCFGDSYAINA